MGCLLSKPGRNAPGRSQTYAVTKDAPEFSALDQPVRDQGFHAAALAPYAHPAKRAHAAAADPHGTPAPQHASDGPVKPGQWRPKPKPQPADAAAQSAQATAGVAAHGDAALPAVHASPEQPPKPGQWRPKPKPAAPEAAADLLDSGAAEASTVATEAAAGMQPAPTPEQLAPKPEACTAASEAPPKPGAWNPRPKSAVAAADDAAAAQFAPKPGQWTPKPETPVSAGGVPAKPGAWNRRPKSAADAGDAAADVPAAKPGQWRPKSAPVAAAAGDAVASPAAGTQKRKLDPRDFTFANLKGETRVKLPGSVAGQQFIIDGCQDCDFYIMDACAMVTVDDCTNCRIFVGPTRSSIFLRNCAGCSCAFLCRQLRTRDCVDCDILLLCRTRPIVETSRNIAFGCYATPYAGLAQQLAAVQLSPLHNFWSDVYDFNPSPGNWRLLSEDLASDVQQLLSAPPAEVAALLAPPPRVSFDGVGLVRDHAAGGGAGSAGEASLFSTWGDRPLPGDSDWARLLVLMPPGGPEGSDAAAAAAFARHQALTFRSIKLVRCNAAPMNADLAKQLAAMAGWRKGVEKQLAAGGDVIGLEFAGTQSQCDVLTSECHRLQLPCTPNDDAMALFRHLGIDG